MVSERKIITGGPPPPSKRHKADGMPPDGMPRMYPQQAYGGGPYMGWQGQYGSHGPPPPHGWQGAPGQGPGMYPPQRGGPAMTPERGGGWSGYRGPHPPPPHPPGSSKSQPPGPPSRSGARGPPMKPNGKGKADVASGGGPNMPPQQYGPGGWNGGNPQWGSPGPYGAPPPSQWHGSHGPPPPHGPPMHQQGPPPPHYQSGWGPGASQTPPRRPRASPEMMNRGMIGGPSAYPTPGGSSVCPPVGLDAPPPGADADMYGSSRMNDDDGQSSMGGKLSDKDKGRGSYKCGRCGVPKKGHVCPYQPKVKRRSGEPAPELKTAAIQVEMDEFMTLRRLNIRIQGFPESYAADPAALTDMVIGERAPQIASRPPSMMPPTPANDMPPMTASMQSGPPPEPLGPPKV